MRSRPHLLLPLVLLGLPLGLLAGCRASPPSQPAAGTATEPVDAAAREEIRAELSAMERAFASGDPGAVARSYADDALLLGPGGVRVSGRAEVDAYWARLTDRADPYAPGERGWTLTAHAFEGRADLVWHRGRSTLLVHRDGAPARAVVDYLLVWRRGPDGRWRIVVDAWH